MTTPDAIRTGLMAALTAVTKDGAGDFAGGVYAYIPATPQPPSMWFYPDTIDYDLAGSRGLDEWTWIVHAIVSANISDQGAQMVLDQLLASSGATSVKQAVEADRTLGGAVDSLRVVKADGYQVFDLPTIGVAIGSTWEVHLLAAA